MPQAGAPPQALKSPGEPGATERMRGQYEAQIKGVAAPGERMATPASTNERTSAVTGGSQRQYRRLQPAISSGTQNSKYSPTSMPDDRATPRKSSTHAINVNEILRDGPEKSTARHNLLEAKDAAPPSVLDEQPVCSPVCFRPEVAPTLIQRWGLSSFLPELAQIEPV